ncbi:hypothetical protein R69746_06837 [Paraburkholderia aspalathi]|uniref:hypothetical protein n=1 Tax=Paraburkholderia aspalathi TaxID=1324617 RepID=UPI00190E2DEC|nr:hypothetical protein [Paraburkholderia aspalathi]MBK3842843.1 hypothetical protein [Paraburkholderia aspalathi]CAE6839201.1 hypothetical protein R69746_06837 [Paraburkholderia aspalathi]
MLNRLFALFGYVPAPAVSLLNDSPAHNPVASEPPTPPHREGAGMFHYAGAARDDLCFWYREGEDTYSYAVGKDDWPPLAVVGFSLAANAAFHDTLNDGIQSRLWLNSRDGILNSWRLANVDTLHSLGHRLDDVSGPVRAPDDTSNFERDMIPFVEGSETASLIAMAWQRTHIDSPVFFLANSRAYAALVSHQAISSAIKAADQALERAFEWLSIWLESRGVEVDRESGLVHLPGYQALFYRTDQSL